MYLLKFPFAQTRFPLRGNRQIQSTSSHGVSKHTNFELIIKFHLAVCRYPGQGGESTLSQHYIGQYDDDGDRGVSNVVAVCGMGIMGPGNPAEPQTEICFITF